MGNTMHRDIKIIATVWLIMLGVIGLYLIHQDLISLVWALR